MSASEILDYSSSTTRPQVPESDGEINAARISSFCSAAISLTGNIVVLLVATVFRHKLNVSSYALTIVYTSCAAIVFSINHVLSCPMIHIHKHELLIINNGIMQNTVLGRTVLCIFAFFVLYSAITSAALLVSKYFIICRMQSIGGVSFHALHFLSCLLSLLWALSFAYAAWFSRTVFADNHEHPLRGRPELYAKMGSASLTISLVILVILILFSFICMVFCTVRIAFKIAMMSDRRHKERQETLFRLLLTQTTLPFILLHLPILIFCTIGQTDLLPEIIIDNMAIVYAW
ncbi:hypothetical protein Y032_0325g2555 [Ancylostoma ceylanicum]|uniref:G-protein coupled receptors family 1 profile domain-containing protein n=1 Tax=Ancylostoma ceylanicum TaxID=53326 RepID=A0A016S0H0_9BILA|nr:hypothetical protein Y032_0325g2555 [Ancylostoma ceylanicum]